MKDRVEDFLAKYKEDAVAVERRFERLGRAAAQRSTVVEGNEIDIGIKTRAHRAAD
jgi:hypothetical protein